jgi:hypothetical protein
MVDLRLKVKRGRRRRKLFYINWQYKVSVEIYLTKADIFHTFAVCITLGLDHNLFEKEGTCSCTPGKQPCTASAMRYPTNSWVTFGFSVSFSRQKAYIFWRKHGSERVCIIQYGPRTPYKIERARNFIQHVVDWRKIFLKMAVASGGTAAHEAMTCFGIFSGVLPPHTIGRFRNACPWSWKDKLEEGDFRAFVILMLFLRGSFIYLIHEPYLRSSRNFAAT